MTPTLLIPSVLSLFIASPSFPIAIDPVVRRLPYQTLPSPQGPQPEPSIYAVTPGF